MADGELFETDFAYMKHREAVELTAAYAFNIRSNVSDRCFWMSGDQFATPGAPHVFRGLDLSAHLERLSEILDVKCTERLQVKAACSKMRFSASICCSSSNSVVI